MIGVIYPTAELDGIVPPLADAALQAVAFEANEIGRPLTRVRTGELLASWLDNWAPGDSGGTDRPPAGLERHPVPRGDSIVRAVRARNFGQGISTTSLVFQGFYLDVDNVFGQVAAQIPEGELR